MSECDSAAMMEDEMDRVIKRFAFSSKHLPQILLSYQQLKSNPTQYFEQVIANFTEATPLSPFKVYANISALNHKWYQLNQYQSILGANIQLDHHILSNEHRSISQQVNNWHETLVQRILSELEREQALKSREVVSLKHDLYRVCLYFLLLRVLHLIEDESVFFTELMDLGSVQVLVHYSNRLQSRKSQLQLKKYMMRRVYSKLPEEFSVVEVISFLQYFQQHANLLEIEQITDLIPQIERFSTGFRKKVPTFQQLIYKLEEHHPEIVVDHAWNYPRLQVRNLFLPAFTRNADHAEIRRYWREHPSETSKNALLTALHTTTTDPFFLDMLLQLYPMDRRPIISSLTMHRIENRQAVVDFLKELPDKYTNQDIDLMFNSYWTRDYRIFNEILIRLDDMDPVNPVSDLIRAKFRLGGIMT